MATITEQRTVAAPVSDVFAAVAHIEEFSTIVDNITKVEFLTDQQSGVGTKFRETRVMKGREASTVLEVTEYELDDRIRIVSDEGGTIWDTVFTVTDVEGATTLTMTMESRPYKLMAKAMNPVIAPMIRKAVASDMDAVAAHFAAGS